MRKVTIDNKDLYEILKLRSVEYKKVTNINDEMVKLDTERKKVAYTMDRLKEKTAKIIKKSKIEMNEFEVITNVMIDDKTKLPTVEIVDQVEEYKELLKEKKEVKK